MKILTKDIETSPTLADVWGLWQQNVGLNQIHDKTRVICFAAKWLHQSDALFYSEHHDSRLDMLKASWDLLDQTDALVTWNGDNFDIPHLQREFYLAGWDPPSPFRSIDLIKTFKRRFRFDSNKLQNIATESGIGQKIKHEGHNLWIKCVYDQDPAAWERMKKYNIGDVKLTERLYKRSLSWIVGHPNVDLYQLDEEGLYTGTEMEPDRCPRCGNTKLQKRGLSVTQLGAYQRFQCMHCGAWSKAGRREYGTSVRSVS